MIVRMGRERGRDNCCNGNLEILICKRRNTDISCKSYIYILHVKSQRYQFDVSVLYTHLRSSTESVCEARQDVGCLYICK